MTYFKRIFVLIALCIISTPALAENWESVPKSSAEESMYLDRDSVVLVDDNFFYNIKYYNSTLKEFLYVTIQAQGTTAGIVKTCKNSQYQKDKSLMKIDTNVKAKKIKKNWSPPKMGKDTRTILHFRVAKNGELLLYSVKKSSGSSEFDNIAINALLQSAPFKPLPYFYKGYDVQIDFTFDYNVSN
jgi:TonB family protein